MAAKNKQGESVGRKIEIDEAGALKLYQMGLNDVEIAKRLGVNNSTVSNWRKRNSLRSNYWKSKNPKKPETMSKLVQDSVMARKVGMSYGEYKCYGG
jgi:transposase